MYSFYDVFFMIWVNRKLKIVTKMQFPTMKTILDDKNWNVCLKFRKNWVWCDDYGNDGNDENNKNDENSEIIWK